MLNENGLTFKDFEKKTFEMICKLGQEYTRDFLERYDTYLMETRDKEAYRNKGKKKTTVKTVHGEVEYERRIYQVTREDGLTEFVFLLDEQLEISGVGLISMNMAEQMVSNITEMSYRETAEKITDMTGQSISAMGVWNVIQALGEKVCEDEHKLVEAHKAGQIKGDKEAPVLFEETDGVYIRLQREKQNKGEIKVGIAYDGWKETGKGRYALDSKVVVAGFSNSKEFQEYREAAIAETYNIDETEVRIMNADGAEWVKNICDADTVFQLDPFHRNKAIKENIPYPNTANALGRIGRADYKLVAPYFKELFILAGDKSSNVRLSFIWASENIATNTPTVYEDCLPIFAELLNDENERVRIEAPEMFRVLGKRTPELVRPYLEKLEYIATHDEVSVVRIYAKGAIRAILSKTIKEPDAKTQNKQVR